MPSYDSYLWKWQRHSHLNSYDQRGSTEQSWGLKRLFHQVSLGQLIQEPSDGFGIARFHQQHQWSCHSQIWLVLEIDGLIKSRNAAFNDFLNLWRWLDRILGIDRRRFCLCVLRLLGILPRLFQGSNRHHWIRTSLLVVHSTTQKLSAGTPVWLLVHKKLHLPSTDSSTVDMAESPRTTIANTSGNLFWRPGAKTYCLC